MNPFEVAACVLVGILCGAWGCALYYEERLGSAFAGSDALEKELDALRATLKGLLKKENNDAE